MHTKQRDVDIRPGDTFDLDASILASVPSGGTAHLEIGVVGYAQRQTTAQSGSGVAAESAGNRYAVNALGGALRVTFPKQRANAALKLFAERANRSTFEGNSVQVFAAIAF